MKTSLLLHPFPFAKSEPPDQSSFASVFGNEAPEALKLALATKKSNPESSSFQPYLEKLYQKLNNSFSATWHNPFESSKLINSKGIESEILATLWNYMASLHSDLLHCDSSDEDSLKMIRDVISDLFALEKNFNQISSMIQNPVFTNDLAIFIESYNQYIADFWQVNFVLLKKPHLAPKPLARCIGDIKRCHQFVRKLTVEERTYFDVICKAIENYLQAYIYFVIGNNLTKDLKYGDAIANYQIGNKFAKNTVNINFSPQLSTANNIMKAALNNALQSAIQNNQNIYNQRVPDTPEELPQPGPATPITPSSHLLFFNSDSIPSDEVPPPQQFPPPPLPPQQFQPPSPPPQQFQPPPPYNNQSSQRLSQNTGFPEWDALLALKQKILPRISNLLQNPNPTYQMICGQLNSQIGQASASDAMIQGMIDSYNTQGGNKNDILNAIKQATTFYTQVEERLNKLETTGM